MGIFYFLTLGAKVEENQVFYLMKWKYGVSHSIITSQTAKEKWPRLLIDFLESRVIWVRNYGRVLFSEDSPEESHPPLGQPKEITCMYDRCYLCPLKLLLVSILYRFQTQAA